MSRPFRFPLDPLLRVRRSELDRARSALAAVLREREAHVREAASHREHGRTRAHALRAELAEQAVGARVLDMAAAVEAHATFAAESGARAQQLEIRVEQLHAALIEVHRRVRALERLRQQARQRHERSEARRAQQALDEIAGLRHLRREQAR